jgi:hypothetical protein
MFPTVAEIAVVDGGLAIADNFIQSQGNLDPVYTCIGSFVSAIFLRRACGYLLSSRPQVVSLYVRVSAPASYADTRHR